MVIHHQIEGDGANVVLLHGWGQNSTMMKPIQQRLSVHYRVCVLDLFGFGKTDDIEDYQTFDDYVEAFHTFLVEHQLEDPILIAHSFGARLAVRYALKYPVKALILTGAAGIRLPLTWKQKLSIRCYKIKKRLGIAQRSGSYDYQHANPFQRKLLVQVVNDDLTPYYHRLTMPVLLVWGEKDDQTPLIMGKMMEKAITKSTLIVLEDDDHFAYYHQSGRFCAIVEAFLEGWCLA